ncbi:hypothetical protein F5148DRAFT_1371262 [Russula earlei]|uniref:Uncharacterized protein n=1 Tax=Russula earlei TaxID=71964 RepID=A0ACC0TTI0_9AGAM|nr:hypothetical protein F5148DRAFT_1371262 [Russula earlei]
MRTSVVATFCLAIGITLSFALPSGSGPPKYTNLLNSSFFPEIDITPCRYEPKYDHEIPGWERLPSKEHLPPDRRETLNRMLLDLGKKHHELCLHAKECFEDPNFEDKMKEWRQKHYQETSIPEYWLKDFNKKDPTRDGFQAVDHLDNMRRKTNVQLKDMAPGGQNVRGGH